MISAMTAVHAVALANGVRLANEAYHKHKVNKQQREKDRPKDYRHEIHFDFSKRYIYDEVAAVNYLANLYTSSPATVYCAGIRYVDTSPETSIELIDYTGNQMIVPIPKILNAIRSNKIMITNAQVYNYGIILYDLS